jgi:YD repeat-containing protein
VLLPGRPYFDLLNFSFPDPEVTILRTLLFVFYLVEQTVRAACPDCAAGALGGPAENRLTAFDALCQGGCADAGQVQLLVNTANLNLYAKVLDLSFGGPAPAVVLEQSYNSDDRGPGPLGNGWTFNLGDTLTAAPDSSWVLRRGSGRVDRFGPAIDATQFFPISATNDVLTRAADGSFTLRNAAAATTWNFNKDGHLVSIQNSGITRVALDYNAAGQLTAARPGGTSGRPIQFSYGADGRIAAIADAAGRTLSFGYDGQGNLVQQTNSDGTTIAYGYDDTGHLSVVNTAAGQVAITYSGTADSSGVSAITLPDGSSRQYAPKGGRQVQVMDAAGNGAVYGSAVPGQTLSITDAVGNQIAYAYDAGGRRISAANANGGVTRFDYDSAGNLTAVTDAAQNRWTATYNGVLLAQLTDANRNTWIFGYDANGRLNQVTDPYGLTAKVSRNAAGFITSAVDPNGNQSNFQYDADGLLTRWIDALGGSWSYQYDGASRVTARAEPGGVTLQAAYDTQNRLSRVSAGSNNLVLNRAGVERDSLNRIAVTADSFGNRLEYSYDAAGRLAALSLPAGKITYQYDSAGRLSKVSDWLGDFAIYKYDAAGAVTGISFGGGPVVAYQYDGASNLRALISAGPDGTVIAGYRYTVDANGNRLSASAAEPSTAGLPVTSASMTYDASNRLRTAADQSYRYDAAGRLIGIDGAGAATFSYDAFGRLTAAGGVQSAYDSLGLRVERNASGTTRRFVYDLSGPRPRVTMETDGSNNPLTYYVWGLGLLWKVTAAGQIYFYHFDGDGNVVALSGGAGIVNRYRYDPLGKLIASDESVENSFRARGEIGWIDDGNGLQYADGNYYSPDLRRWLPGSVNLDAPNPALVLRFPGAGACFVATVADCSLGTGRRAR